ncbi:hypothetical protein [Cryobacterium sp.]|jgi:hypothetical protein|uniref:hypothetical protein n=1 Tax=Cryobacterium sp. TaxID=1926290 RepID=UPI0026141E74|nr:hypothetical protein [Cryobacterium sp.]MCU1445731.1 putative segregation ATPase [Cryobacterium sp.]
MPTSTRTRLATLTVAAGLMVSLSACGTAPWAGLSTDAATAGGTPTPKATIAAITNDLATGSAQHTITAGDAGLTVDYSSALNMGEWTAGANKPISFTVSAALGTDDGQAVYLSKVSVIPGVTGPDGALEAPAPLIDESGLANGYFMKAPYSYGQTFVLPAVDSNATSITLSFTYELLIQTTPTSSTFAKQTASDQLTIAIAP